MDSTFFDSKRPWSRYKDFLLKSYLEPYIPKVASLKRPILIVDCFAGMGRFKDGEEGSPLIIADAIQRWSEKLDVNITGEFIEANSEIFGSLQQSLEEFHDFCTPRLGTFDETLIDLEKQAKRNTVFLYVDPYTVKGLRFERMKKVFDQISKSSSSVEVLMNFNIPIFMRWALAALKRLNEMPDSEELEPEADDPNETVERRILSEIAGGDYWISIASNDNLSFSEKIDEFLNAYVCKLRESFKYVCSYPVKEKYRHQVPKYVMLFATGHPDGILLMNDFMCKARREFVEQHFAVNHLFDTTPEEEIVEQSELRNEILNTLNQFSSPRNRKAVGLKILLNGFVTRVTLGEIKKEISAMIKDDLVFSSTGKSRINDTVLLSTTPFE
ncbi:hypothetical protein Pan153_57860 [Gimesia panareensis]|uniref:Three-Cys-motif partner protein TcmP n=1 Tax=Gimesia panareensis TaxID=2527978 RepID=A0A518FXT0_9PLAN|nr:three-Cys-motif partner protein TcmP [Gimesia panareensis]QDV21104.1 hypothetical protein Pan153_57860 [Gimesia panareensis]